MKVLFGSALALLLVVGLYGCSGETPATEVKTVSLNIEGMT